jgi:hypothetical protein
MAPRRRSGVRYGSFGMVGEISFAIGLSIDWLVA